MKKQVSQSCKFEFETVSHAADKADRSRASGAGFAITASIVDSNCTPLGLFIDNGIVVQKLNSDTGKSGNFYLLENGIFAISKNNDIDIIRSKEYTYNANTRLAIQTGPLLIWNSIRLFTRSSNNTNMRCGVGIYKRDGIDYVIFAKSNSPVSIKEFGDFFAELYKCNAALILESGNSAAMYLPNEPSSINPNVAFICRTITLTCH